MSCVVESPCVWMPAAENAPLNVNPLSAEYGKVSKIFARNWCVDNNHDPQVGVGGAVTQRYKAVTLFDDSI